MIGLMMLTAATVAGFQDGNKLYALCASNLLGCATYVEGVADASNALTAGGAVKPFMCQPPNATPRQLVDITAKYLAEHPESRAEAGAELVMLALRRAFPCR